MHACRYDWSETLLAAAHTHGDPHLRSQIALDLSSAHAITVPFHPIRSHIIPQMMQGKLGAALASALLSIHSATTPPLDALSRACAFAIQVRWNH